MNARSPVPFGSDEQIERLIRRWSEAGTTAFSSLLRLSVLRELYRLLHAEKSLCLATGRKDELADLKTWENRIEGLRHSATLDKEGDLVALLQRPESPKKRSRVLPQSLFEVLSKEKLERYDRIWENTLTAEACALGWNLWQLETWVQVPEVEKWNTLLNERLWPTGLVLFADSAGFEESPDADSAHASWCGQWTLLLHGSIRHPSELLLGFETWAGYSGKSVNWKRLFVPPAHLLRR